MTQAQSFLASKAMPYQILSAEHCEASAPAEVDVCPGGPLLLVALPVKNRVCRFYRDRSIRVQLGFNSAQQLVRIQTDMNPYRMLKLPALGVEVYWGR